MFRNAVGFFSTICRFGSILPGLLGLALLSCATAPRVAKPVAPHEIRGIRVEDFPEKTVLVVEGGGPIPFEKSERGTILTVNLEGIGPGQFVDPIEVNRGGIVRVRPAALDDATRLEVEFVSATSSVVRPFPGGLLVEVTRPLPPPGDPNGNYLIGPEDLLDVVVWKNEQISRKVQVRPDGRISLPLIGDVPAVGLTVSELRGRIAVRLKEFMETPEVSVIVAEANGNPIFVLGEVVHPGKFLLRRETTLLQAISLAGGFTQYASRNKMVLLRREVDGEKRIRIRYDDIVKGRAENLTLRAADTLVVP